jgi:transcriptional regulator with XRE-family HTH domain
MWFRIRGAEGLGAALATARRQKPLTQRELAEHLGVERTTVLNMEAGRTPALARVVRAFSILGYDLIAVPRGAKVVVTEPSRDIPVPTGG